MEFKGRMAVVGGGNMGTALIKGILKTATAKAEQIVVAEKATDKAEKLAKQLGVKTVPGPEHIGDVDLVLFAVKPQDLKTAADCLKKGLDKKVLFISIAAGVTIEKLAKLLPEKTAVVRAMPNTPALISMGATALSAGPDVTVEQKELAQGIFEAVGLAVWVKEENMDAVTGLSGSGPAYVFMFIEALSDAGVFQGLPRDTSLMLAAQTVAGAAKLLQMNDKHPAQLKDMVTSPGGTTISGVHALESQGLRGALMDAVARATQRSRELGS